MILPINSKPRIVKVVDTMIPINPIIIPQINATPSLLNKPSDIINIPTPGIKFERGIGSKIKEENIDAGEHPHQAALHDEEQHEVNLETLGAGLDRVEAGGETDESGEHEERERNAVEAELQADAETVEAGGVAREKCVAVVLRGVAEVPPHMQCHEHGNRKGSIG